LDAPFGFSFSQLGSFSASTPWHLITFGFGGGGGGKKVPEARAIVLKLQKIPPRIAVFAEFRKIRTNASKMV